MSRISFLCKKENPSFFQVPSKPDTRRKMFEFLQRSYAINCSYILIYKLHFPVNTPEVTDTTLFYRNRFDEGCIKFSGKSLHLEKEAVPTIFLYFLQ